MTKRIKGFTLIELLVVIVIIGILATLATVTLSSARGKARDARRVSDVKQIQTALELYYSDTSTYPEAAEVVAGSALSTSTPAATYMAKIPSNASPVNEGSCTTDGAATYVYQLPAGTPRNRTTYNLVYCLGSATGSVSAGTHTATPAGLF